MKKIKIAFTGPESSGKTTLSEWLSIHLSCGMIKEYAREYLSYDKAYTMYDINCMAEEQFKRNNSSNEKVVLDTEMLVMKIWCEEKYHKCSESILLLLEKQEIDCYFLCKPDIPWEADPLRENSLDRDRLFDKYEQNLKELGFPYHVISGTLDERQNKIIETLQNRSWL